MRFEEIKELKRARELIEAELDELPYTEKPKTTEEYHSAGYREGLGVAWTLINLAIVDKEEETK